MDMEKVIERAERNIRQALKDYGAHTDETRVLEDVSSSFITRLARDSSYAKQELRELFSKSPVWCEDIDALVINGTRTHDPDYERIRDLAVQILEPARRVALRSGDGQLYDDINSVVCFFSDVNPAHHDQYIEAINRLAPKAYAPGKKLSRVFKAICVKLGVADETAGSEFQHLYAQFADELTSRKISFKLYVSINPAHFLTMSNPKWDKRGQCLTSCHSFNSTEYEYNNGCSGYARDEHSFIVFTVDDPTNPETLNNRKTTRQIFAYKPGNGLLLQSRMYNTSGGVYGAAEDSKLYRDLVQREISMLEGVPNLWDTGLFYGKHDDCVERGEGFGGYPDWIYENFDAHVSIRKDHADDYEPLTVGAYGLCICCGEETSDGLYCGDCKNEASDRSMCDHCEEYFDDDDLYPVHDERGNTIYVCANCREEYYAYCDDCGEYWPEDMVRETGDGDHVCDRCIEEDYEQCEDCDEYYRRADMTEVHSGRGYEVWVCEDCRDENYMQCEDCDEYYPTEDMYPVYREDGTLVYVCEDCHDGYETCPHCDELIQPRHDGTCPHCGAVIDEDENEDNDEDKEAESA